MRSGEVITFKTIILLMSFSWKTIIIQIAAELELYGWMQKRMTTHTESHSSWFYIFYVMPSFL